MESKVFKTPSSIYLMHKYWGKKPSNELIKVIDKYSKKGDTILDPFSGFGGLGIEGILMNRNVILNDLNPIANFISKNILCNDVNIDVLSNYYNDIKKEYEFFSREWYFFNGYKILSILRKNDDSPLKLKLQELSGKKTFEYLMTNEEIKEFVKKERDYEIRYWFPTDKLIKNSRICIKEDMHVNDLFSKRELICQSFLYDLIEKIPNSNEKDLLKLAFTSNLANCSKLVPPIKSRGDMSQGAWMTGFYIGEVYLENNVFHYFENRVSKIIKGKKDYINLCLQEKKIGNYIITNNDAKNLNIDNETIDFVFTDFPYGDTVPYFEQSQLWNSWLKFGVDYNNEIVVSNSNERNKNEDNFVKDIEEAIREINRVLKDGSYFAFTFHSLNGIEWEAIANALVQNNFEFIDCEAMLQKTFTPRQLNRKITVKGDLLVVYKKKTTTNECILSLVDIKTKIEKEIRKLCSVNKLYDTNFLITLCVKCLLKYNCINKDIDFMAIINEYFVMDDNGGWKLKNEL